MHDNTCSITRSVERAGKCCLHFVRICAPEKALYISPCHTSVRASEQGCAANELHFRQRQVTQQQVRVTQPQNETLGRTCGFEFSSIFTFMSRVLRNFQKPPKRSHCQPADSSHFDVLVRGSNSHRFSKDVLSSQCHCVEQRRLEEHGGQG